MSSAMGCLLLLGCRQKPVRQEDVLQLVPWFRPYFMLWRMQCRNQDGSCAAPLNWCEPPSRRMDRDCDGDGVADPYCWSDQDIGFIGSATRCIDTWPLGGCGHRGLANGSSYRQLLSHPAWRYDLIEAWTSFRCSIFQRAHDAEGRTPRRVVLLRGVTAAWPLLAFWLVLRLPLGVFARHAASRPSAWALDIIVLLHRTVATAWAWLLLLLDEAALDVLLFRAGPVEALAMLELQHNRQNLLDDALLLVPCCLGGFMLELLLLPCWAKEPGAAPRALALLLALGVCAESLRHNWAVRCALLSVGAQVVGGLAAFGRLFRPGGLVPWAPLRLAAGTALAATLLLANALPLLAALRALRGHWPELPLAAGARELSLRRPQGLVLLGCAAAPLVNLLHACGEFGLLPGSKGALPPLAPGKKDE